MPSKDPILVIKDFNNAIADSPLFGHGYMRNIDLDTYIGSIKVQKKLLAGIVTTKTGLTFTADPITDVCTASADVASQPATFDKAAVTFTTTGTLPAGLSLSTIYFLKSGGSQIFQVCTTLKNVDDSVVINITDAGTGTHTIVPVSIGTIKWIIKDEYYSRYFALDTNGRVWCTFRDSWQSTYPTVEYFFLLTGNNLTGSTANGLAIFRNSSADHTYLFVFKNTSIDVIDVHGAAIYTPVWTTGWQSVNTSSLSSKRNYAKLGQDNIIYFTNDRYVGSIHENAGQNFDPANGATYTFNNQALTLPQQEDAYCLEELGINLLVGGKTFNLIYPWNRSSISYNLPLVVPESGIYEIKNVGNTIYIFAGQKGNIYQSQGSYIRPFKTISGYIINNAGTIAVEQMAWGGSAIANGSILIGVYSLVSGNSGVYRVYPDGRIVHDNTPYGGSGQVSAIHADNDFFKIGYAGNIDYHDTTRYAAGTYSAIYESQLYKLSNKIQKETISEVEFVLARPAGTANIRLSSRASLSASWVVCTNGTIATDSTNTNFVASIGLTDLINQQFKIEFDAGVEIVEVRFFR